MICEKDTHSKQFNVVFIGRYPYPQGMAGTKRNQHAIDGLKTVANICMQVMILRQSSKNNPVCGVHNSVFYQTLVPDSARIRLLFGIFKIYVRGIRAIHEAYAFDKTNILIVYGPPTVENAPLIVYAKSIGFLIVFDIVEDESTALSISSSLWHIGKTLSTRLLRRLFIGCSNGLIVISSYLEKKMMSYDATKKILLRPISVDFTLFPERDFRFNQNTIKLFYAGSYGVRDGVENLIEAFELLSVEFPILSVVLAGKGSDKQTQKIVRRIEQSPFRQRIEFKGYLSDSQYYETLNECDIPCMIRIDSGYAHAGFPFKLGEYLATGKPVVASKVSDVHIYLHDKKNALLVKPGSVDCMVRAIRFLLLHPSEAAVIGKAGRQVAMHHFNYCTQAHALYDFISHLKTE